jgi:hypothetical protein
LIRRSKTYEIDALRNLFQGACSQIVSKSKKIK